MTNNDAIPPEEPERRGAKRRAASSEKQPAPRWIPIDQIDLADRRFQLRFETETADLRDSMERQGQRVPIDLMGAKPPYRIIDGFQRVEAARGLRWRSILAVVHEGISESVAWRLAFTKNVVRSNLHPVERVNAIQIALREGFPKTELGRLFGLSDRQVGRYLAMLRMPDAILEVFDGRIVTMAHAKVLAEFDIRDTSEWRARIEQEELDAKELRRLLEKEGGHKPKGRPRQIVSEHKGKLRVRADVSLTAPEEEKLQVIDALRHAISRLLHSE